MDWRIRQKMKKAPQCGAFFMGKRLNPIQQGKILIRPPRGLDVGAGASFSKITITYYY
jgi:hypothetical protein